MADRVESLLQGVSPSATGTFYSIPFNTIGYRNFAFALRLPTTGGSGSDTLDIWLEASPDNSFADPYKIQVLALTPRGGGTIADKFTQVVGGTTLPAATQTATPLRQFWNYTETNIDGYIRVKYTVAGTATSFTNIFVDVLADRRV